MYCGVSGWAYIRERKVPFATTSFEKGVVGVFSRVGLFSGDYGTCPNTSHGRQLNTKVCGSEGAIFLFLLSTKIYRE